MQAGRQVVRQINRYLFNKILTFFFKRKRSFGGIFHMWGYLSICYLSVCFPNICIGMKRRKVVAECSGCPSPKVNNCLSVASILPKEIDILGKQPIQCLIEQAIRPKWLQCLSNLHSKLNLSLKCLQARKLESKDNQSQTRFFQIRQVFKLQST